MIIIENQDKDKTLGIVEQGIELNRRLELIKKKHPKLILNLQRDFLIEREQAESRFWEEVEEIKARAKQKEDTILRILVESEDKRGGIITIAEQANTLTSNNKNNNTAKKYITNPEASSPTNTPNDNRHKYY
ncbi:MAG: hypothetical protein R3Y29_05030 [bacterium]